MKVELDGGLACQGPYVGRLSIASLPRRDSRPDQKTTRPKTASSARPTLPHPSHTCWPGNAAPRCATSRHHAMARQLCQLVFGSPAPPRLASPPCRRRRAASRGVEGRRGAALRSIALCAANQAVLVPRRVSCLIASPNQAEQTEGHPSHQTRDATSGQGKAWA